MSAPRSMLSQAAGLAVCLLLVFAAAGIGGYGSRDAPGFYAALIRPAWAPPAAWFGPVWTVLYLLMTVAAWLVWRKRDVPGRGLALGLFVDQLVLNAWWPWAFFAWHSGLGSTVVILLLWLSILLTLKRFWAIQPAAGMLLVPYLAWVSFAAALNVALWQSNRAAL